MNIHQNFIIRFLGLFFVVVLITSLVMFTFPAIGSPNLFPALSAEEILTFGLIDDASLISSYPTTNYGSAAALEVDNSPVKNILLKTSLSGINGRLVTKAILRLYSVGSSNKGGDFYFVPTNAWDEHSVNWNNAPSADPTLLYSLGTVSSGIWYEVDLTSILTSDGVYSFRIASTTTDGADYSSNEGSYPAQLLVYVSNAFTDTPTSTPTDWPFPVTPTETSTSTLTPTITITPTPSKTPTLRFTPTLLPTIAPPNPGTVRFAVFSDPGGYNDREAADVINLIKSWGVEFIVTAGDNNPCTAADWDSCVGSNFHDFIYPYTGSFGSGAVENKLWPAMGNHDWNADILGWYSFFTLPNNERYYSIASGPVRFFILDSDGREPDGNTLSSIQGQWFANNIATATEPWKLVVFHNPPYSSAYHGSSTRMRWGFENYAVAAVFSGHDHVYERSSANNVTYFVVGTGGDSLYAFNTPNPESIVRYNSNYGAMLIEASECQIDYKFISRANLLIDTYSQVNPSCGFTSSPTPTDTPTPTVALTSTPTDTPTIEPTPTDTPTIEPTPTDTPTLISSPTVTASSTDTATPTRTSIPVSSPTQTATSTGTPTPQPTPLMNPIFVTLQNIGPTTIGELSGVSYNDVIYYDGTDWSLFFDGSDVGLAAPISAFTVVDSSTILLTFGKTVNLSPIGKVSVQDIVQFTGTLGSTTSGTFSMYFDGSDVGLDKTQESIISLNKLSNGQLVIGTKGAASVPGVSAALEDLMIFTPTSLGATTKGSWALYLDGSDVGLTGTARIDGLAIDVNGDLYLSTAGVFSLGGLTGDNEDVIVCSPTSLGTTTACAFHPELYFDGSQWGLSGNNVDSIGLP